MTIPPLLIVALLIFGRTTYALHDGSAANNGRSFRRGDAPVVYWGSIFVGYAACGGIVLYALVAGFAG